ncbi:MAG: GTPase ObgE [Actinobacteria bacterium]|nr:GTPase ObgE [Actinomycetota bacterium]
MSFVDEARIHVTAGDGGHGAVTFHREPYKPKGGPDGGDGGDGGSVILRADGSVGTLLDIRDHPHVRAEHGGKGQGARKTGARGSDRVILVPPGTVVYDVDDTLLADLAAAGQEFVAARGGRGGRGNSHFASATRRAPGFAENGEPGDELDLRLELRLLADVGLVGFPNAGKSTLISRISRAKPKIADYPFTTLTPNLGMVSVDDTSFVVADIPGLVPGAAEGKGLGHQFLRHVRRAAVLVFMADLVAPDRDPGDDFDILRAELEAFDPELAGRPSVLVAAKIDAGREVWEEMKKRHPDALPVSAVSGENIEILLARLRDEVERSRASSPAPLGYIRHVARDEPIEVEREDSAWRVKARRAELAVAATNMANEEAVARLQRKLIALGVERALAGAGAKEGDEVRIGPASFDFIPEPAADAPDASR